MKRDHVARISRLAALLVALSIVAACAGSGTVIDGWPIGPAVNCDGPQAPPCRELIDAAKGALDKRDPAHAAVVDVELHEEGQVLDALGNPILLTRTVQLFVARFRLADGSDRAIGTGQSPGGVLTQPHGP